MKRILHVFLVVTFFASLFYFGEAHARRKDITDIFDEKGITKACVSDVKNSSGDNNVNVDEIRKNIEKALVERRSHAFEVVTSEASADILIEVDVIEYFWTDKDPVDVVFPPVAAAIDSASVENYARLTANIIVKNAKNGNKMWGDDIRATLTDDTMTKEESYGLIVQRLGKDFVARLCKKPKEK